MARPSDEEYYIDDRTEHVAQGDIFRDIPFTWATAAGEPVGFDGYGMLLTYTSGMMKQPPRNSRLQTLIQIDGADLRLLDAVGDGLHREPTG